MSAGQLRTRLATAADAAAIAAIYNEGIADRIATFETEPRTVEQIAAQLADKGDRFPPWSSSGTGRSSPGRARAPTASRPAYAGVAEHSVYVARAARGSGAGRAALEALCRAYARARASGRSCRGSSRRTRRAWRLHERCGFRAVGVYRRHGKLEGQWRDCVIVERMLDEPAPGD